MNHIQTSSIVCVLRLRCRYTLELRRLKVGSGVAAMHQNHPKKNWRVKMSKKKRKKKENLKPLAHSCFKKD